MERESYVCYKSFIDAGMKLSDEDRLKYYDRIMKYAIYGIDEKTTGFAETMFILIRPNLDSNNKKYIDGCKGGRPKKTTGYGNEKTTGYVKGKPNVDVEEDVEVEEEVNVKRKRKKIVASFEDFIELIQGVDWKKEFPNRNIEVEQKKCWAKLGGKMKDAKATFRNWLLPHPREKEYIQGLEQKTDEQRIEEFLSGKNTFNEKYGFEKYQEVKDKWVLKCLQQPLEF